MATFSTSDAADRVISVVTKIVKDCGKNEVFDLMKSEWYSLKASNDSEALARTILLSSDKLLIQLFKKCISTLSHNEWFIICQDILLSCGVAILKLLSGEPSSIRTTSVTELVLWQIIHPESQRAKIVCQNMLQSCALYFWEPIKTLLNEVLLTGVTPARNMHSVKSEIYSLIYELLLINKYLVNGLLNNIELCLARCRKDRLEGVEFLYQYFAHKEFDFKPTLWLKFVLHYEDVCISSAEHVLMIQHTPNLLARFCLRKDWCKVLLARIKLENNIFFELQLTNSILRSLETNFANLLLNDEDGIIMAFLETLLDPKCTLKRKAWKGFYSGLAVLCSKLISESFGHMDPTTLLRKASVVLKLVLGPCRHIDTYNGTCARSAFRLIITGLLETNSNRGKKLILAGSGAMLCYLPAAACGMTTFDKFLKKLQANSKLIINIRNLLDSRLSSKDSFAVIGELSKVIDLPDEIDKQMLSSICYGLAIHPYDRASFEELLHITDLHINGEIPSIEFVSPEKALKLLTELLTVSPTLGHSETAISYFLEWIKNSSNEVSTSALRCVLSSELSLNDNSKSVKSLLSEILAKISEGTWRQAKIAVRCLLSNAFHSPDSFSRVFQLISTPEMLDISKGDIFLRRVVTLGSCAAFCPDYLTETKVEELALNVLLRFILEDFAKVTYSSVTCSPLLDSSKWVEWEHLPFRSLLLVRVFRALSMCMRYCGSETNVAMVLQQMENIITNSPHKNVSDISDVEVDHFRLEAGCVALNILERKPFYLCASMELFYVLSQLMTDSRLEVRRKFTEKLCRGLKPIQRTISERGKSRGNLCAPFLGFLPLLGWNFCKDETHPNSRPEDIPWAQSKIQEVLFVRSLYVEKLMSVKGLSLSICHNTHPGLLPANSLYYAIPMLASQALVEPADSPNDSFHSRTDNDCSIIQIAVCLAFMISELHGPVNRFQVSKASIKAIIRHAKNCFIFPSNELLLEKCLAAWEVLDFVIDYYSPTEPIHLRKMTVCNILFGSCQERSQLNDFSRHLTGKLKDKIHENLYKLLFMERDYSSRVRRPSSSSCKFDSTSEGENVLEENHE